MTRTLHQGNYLLVFAPNSHLVFNLYVSIRSICAEALRTLSLTSDWNRASAHEISAATVTFERAPSPATATRLGSLKKQSHQPTTTLLGSGESVDTTSCQKSAYSAQALQPTTQAVRFLTYDRAKDIHFAAASAPSIPGSSASKIYSSKSKACKPGAGSSIIATKWRKRHSATNSLELGRNTSLNKISRTSTTANMFGMGRLLIAEEVAIPMTPLHPHALLSPKRQITTRMDSTTKVTSKDST